jgi:hypothetical protein
VVKEEVSFESVKWEHQLTITDIQSEGNADGGKAMQVFWNRNPIKGTALLKPYNIDRTGEPELDQTIFRIDYDETGTNDYEATMMVTIDDLPEASGDPFAIDKLQMFVGKAGDVVDVFGNSNHPNATFFTEDVGFNWAFVASGNDPDNYGVAEVGLPPSNLDADDRVTLLETYSVKQVFTDQLLEIFPNLTEELIDRFLVNTEAPGFFEDQGFIQGGESPDPKFEELVDRIQNLTPYNPKDISEVDIQFN